MGMSGHNILLFEVPAPDSKGVAHARAGPVFFPLTLYMPPLCIVLVRGNIVMRMGNGTLFQSTSLIIF